MLRYARKWVTAFMGVMTVWPSVRGINLRAKVLK